MVTERKVANRQLVRSINGITDDVQLAAGNNVSLAVQGQQLFISASAGGDGQSNRYSLDAVDGDPVDALFVDESGRVGIGTTHPTQRLDIQGNLGLTESSIEGGDTTGVITVGGKRFIHDAGNRNFFAGEDAGNLSVSTGFSTGSDNTGLGSKALREITDGEGNTAVGSDALTNNETGNGNVAVGNTTMVKNLSGNSNVAVGEHAMQNNTTANDNVAVGSSALVFNETGTANVAIGVGSLSNNRTGDSNVGVGAGTLGNANEGSGNTAVGNYAMSTSKSGSNNTAIGSFALLDSDDLTNATAIGANAVVDASNKIRLGDDAVSVVEAHATFHSLSGGFMFPDGSTQTTAVPPGGNTWLLGTQLHVVRAINAAASLTNHAAIVENSASSTNNGPDVLALKTSAVSPGANTNMISFFDGNNSAIGRIEGNGAGGIVYGTTGGDYAEALPRLDPSEHIEKGDIVGVVDGKITRKTASAQQFMVISSRPAVLGNAPDEGTESLYENVAFVGQVETKVLGPVRSGDFIVPSGVDDGVGVALASDRMTSEQLSRIVARAWETSDEMGVKSVNALIGMPMYDAVAALRLSEKDDRIRQLESRLDRMSQLVHELEKKVDQLTPSALARN